MKPCLRSGIRAAIATVAVWSVAVVPLKAQPVSLCEDRLSQAIDAVRQRHSPRASWGILIEPLASNRQIYSENAQQYLLPASNAKLLTTAAALQRLGGDYRVRTSVYITETPPTGNRRKETQDLGQELHVIGRGDPSLTEDSLMQLARQVADAGVESVDRLVLHDSDFGGDAINPNWDWEDVRAGYGAPVNSAIVDRNEIPFILHPRGLGQPLRVEWERSRDRGIWTLDNRSRTVSPDTPEWLSVGRDFHSRTIHIEGQLIEGSPAETVSVAVVDPATVFLQQFRQALAANQIAVGESVVVEEPMRVRGREIAALRSPTVAELVDRVNGVSDNLYAEVLLRWLGTTAPNDGTSAARRGLQVVEDTLASLGVAPDSYVLNDGSGLSRLNWVSPEALVDTLQAMARSPYADLYRRSLPVAGESGTLRSRLLESPAVIYAKTGTLTGVSALSGYLDRPSYGTLVFSIIVNNSDETTARARSHIDEILLLLARSRPCLESNDKSAIEASIDP